MHLKVFLNLKKPEKLSSGQIYKKNKKTKKPKQNQKTPPKNKKKPKTLKKSKKTHWAGF
jgi:hypothetical protein